MTAMTQNQRFQFNPEISNLVNAELADDSRYHPNLGGVTRGGMANHFPMTVTAMQAMGASDAQVEHFIQSWPRHRALIDAHLHLEDHHELNDENWFEYLGNTEKLREFRRVFLGQLTTKNEQQVISKALEKMKFGLPMGLFHPVIRLSFAHMHGDKGLLADALAYMAIRYLDLYPAYSFENENRFSSDLNASDVWRSVSQTIESQGISRVLPDFPAGGSLNICERLCSDRNVQKFAMAEGFAVTIENVDERVIQICQASVQLYLFDPSLTTLHAVTASQALADLAHGKNDSALEPDVAVQLWQLMWVWLTALYIEKGYPDQLLEADQLTTNLVPNMTWQRLFDRALDTQEVHVIKMAFSCKWLFDEVEPNPLYRLAVMKMLGVTSPNVK